MFFQESGTVLIGFAGKDKCSHCNNETIRQIRQGYDKFTILGAVPLFNVQQTVWIVCPVCEIRRDIICTHFMARPFASDEKWQLLHNLLNSGQDYTKIWINQLQPKERSAALQRLNIVRAYNLVRYIES